MNSGPSWTPLIGSRPVAQFEFKDIGAIVSKTIGTGWLFVLILLALAVPTEAQVVSYQAPGITASRDFQIWVNGQRVFTGQAGSQRQGYYSFSTFDFSGSATIKIKSLMAIKWLDLLPSSLNIDHFMVDEYTFEFTLEEPADVTVLLNNDRNNALHLLTNKPEINQPVPGEEGVLFYKAGETYDVGVLDLKDDQTLYIEGGARLKGMIRVRDAKNVRILGRGMIDGTDNKSQGNGRFKDEPWRLIYMENASQVKVAGITLYNSLKWTIHTYDCSDLEFDHINIVNSDYGSDGIDISGCQRVKITNSFLRTNDDCVVLKSLSFAENSYYPNPRRQNPDVEEILVEGCTLWNMPYGNCFEIGFELRCSKVKNVIYRDCDVIMQQGRGAVFSIHNSDNAVVENILYDNIRVENADQGNANKLFDLAILFSVWSYDRFEKAELNRKYRYNDTWDNLLPVLPGRAVFHSSHRGHIRNIRFHNIQVLDGKFPFSVINGFDEDHLVENVTFEDITVKGKRIASAEELKLVTRFAKDIQIR